MLGEGSAVTPFPCQGQFVSVECLSGYAGYLESGEDLLLSNLAPTALDGEASPASGGSTDVRQLPPGPGSAALLLSGLLSMGAFPLAKSARHVHFIALPAWYHPDAPHQMGHSFAFDPALDFGLLAVCVFDALSVAEPVRCPDTPHELPSPYESQHFLAIESPRGPPLVS
jgi:hypothetical protein